MERTFLELNKVYVLDPDDRKRLIIKLLREGKTENEVYEKVIKYGPVGGGEIRHVIRELRQNGII